MIERNHPSLSVGMQCRLLSLSRSSFYYEPQGETGINLALMLLIDKQFLDTPFYGVQHLKNEAHPAADAPHAADADLREARHEPPREGPQTYPYLLGGLRVDRPNQVWCADITYLPMRRGFLYLVAIMDWFTRKVLAWRVSNTPEANFCVEALSEALHRFGSPEISAKCRTHCRGNTDQGSQFTSFAWTDQLKRAGTGSRWTARAAASTTFSSSACGDP
jgi:putative transposase